MTVNRSITWLNNKADTTKIFTATVQPEGSGYFTILTDSHVLPNELGDLVSPFVATDSEIYAALNNRTVVRATDDQIVYSRSLLVNEKAEMLDWSK